VPLFRNLEVSRWSSFELAVREASSAHSADTENS